jgi:ribonuclease HII
MSETPSLANPDLHTPSLPRRLEKSLFQKDKKDHFVIGVDEAGRGPLAGPVVAAAFTFSKSKASMPVELSKGITDSKQVSEGAREYMYYNHLKENSSVLYKVSVVDNRTIDKINILQATFKAMTESTLSLIAEIKKSHPLATFSILIDGNKIPPAIAESGHEAQFVIKGDSLEFVIAAASICAKVERDAMMKQLDCEFPQYGFAQHKGYPTGSHVAAIKQHGPCKHHRMTFAPLKFLNLKKRKGDVEQAAKPKLTSQIDAREERLKRRNILKSTIN